MWRGQPQNYGTGSKWPVYGAKLIPVDHADEADRAIRDLFSQAHDDEPQDRLFVAGVMRQIARRRRLRTAATAVAAALFVGIFLFAMPTLMTSTNVVASLPLLVIEPFQRLLASPAGFLVSLPIGFLLLALSTVRLTDLNG
jgi:hypothetical protein